MTFPSDDEYGESLRRALRAEADSVVPSPEGLDIIRRRIDQRGLRGLRNVLWLRVGAAAAGAVLAAGAVVMLVPGLREQVADRTGIAVSGDAREEDPQSSTVTRPPADGAPSRPGVVIIVTTSPSPSHGRTSPSPSHRPGPATKPSPSPSDPCASPPARAGVVDPEPTLPATCPPVQTTQPAPPSATHTTAPSSAPPTATATPSATPSAPPTETVTPNAADTPTP
ncbi:hypothetical protein [Microbispora amethystogenes]|uniref:hypothetical protein n=1 Tax=Microbispora amethystogenes TaxID=1427754 RepID=UPI00195370E3|nr:hypothetical protein [Microbispora amethystogenes]